jgi:hypothetical protein
MFILVMFVSVYVVAGAWMMNFKEIKENDRSNGVIMLLFSSMPFSPLLPSTNDFFNPEEKMVGIAWCCGVCLPFFEH